MINFQLLECVCLHANLALRFCDAASKMNDKSSSVYAFDGVQTYQKSSQIWWNQSKCSCRSNTRASIQCIPSKKDRVSVSKRERQTERKRKSNVFSDNLANEIRIVRYCVQ